VAFILIATPAVQACLAARPGALQTAPATLAVLASLILGARRHWRTAPGAIKIGPDGLTIWNCAGQMLAHGRIAGCSPWSGRLLILALADASGRSRALPIAAGRALRRRFSRAGRAGLACRARLTVTTVTAVTLVS